MHDLKIRHKAPLAWRLTGYKTKGGNGKKVFKPPQTERVGCNLLQCFKMNKLKSQLLGFYSCKK
jgi:hypothetical protein